MRISISSLAWAREENPAVVRILKKKKIDAIDVTPAHCTSDTQNPNLSEAVATRTWWADHGIEIIGMQALLFGTTGLALFKGEYARSRTLDHLTRVAALAHAVGATRLTFGSPSNRDRSGLTDLDADLIAAEFFRELGDRVDHSDVVFCIEPNPAAYGCNFLTETVDAKRFVELVDHPNVRLQLDTGTIAMNGEDPESTILKASPLIGHIHLSEPHLVPVGSGATPHHAISAALLRYEPDAIATIEMKAAGLEAIERSVDFAVEQYHGEYR